LDGVKTKEELNILLRKYPTFDLSVLEDELGKYKAHVAASMTREFETAPVPETLTNESIIEYANSYADSYVKLI